jgi:hypothetical protein
MSRPVNQTKVPYKYYGKATRNRGYGRRRLFLVRPRPGTPCSVFYTPGPPFFTYTGTLITFNDGLNYFFHDTDDTFINGLLGAASQWQYLNANMYFSPSPDATDWLTPGPTGFWYHMTTPRPVDFHWSQAIGFD